MVIAIPYLVRLTPDGAMHRDRQSGLPKLTRWNTALDRFFDFLSILWDDSVVKEIDIAQYQPRKNTILQGAENIEYFSFQRFYSPRIGVIFSLFRLMNLHHRVEYV